MELKIIKNKFEKVKNIIKEKDINGSGITLNELRDELIESEIIKKGEYSLSISTNNGGQFFFVLNISLEDYELFKYILANFKINNCSMMSYLSGAKTMTNMSLVYSIKKTPRKNKDYFYPVWVKYSIPDNYFPFIVDLINEGYGFKFEYKEEVNE